MNISKFASEQNTTIDTVKYYIKLGLLTPMKENNWHKFSDKDVEDFKNIIFLKQIGLSLDVIKKIKISHDMYCGTILQWKTNLDIINGEIDRVIREKEELVTQEILLNELKVSLEQKLSEK